jgi:hypothetical protein
MATVDLSRRPAMRWAVAGAVTVVAVGVVAGGVLLSTPDDLDDLMVRRTEAALERVDPAASHDPSAHAGHGQPANPDHRVDIDGHELRCAAKVFGHEPADASSIDEVKVIYAHRMCAAVGPGLVWPDSIRETGPVAVRLGVPDTVVLPERAIPDNADADYADRIRAVIPRPFHDDALAFTDFVDPDVAEELQDRVED